MKKILLIFSLILGIFCQPAFASEIDLENIDAEYVFVGGSATITFDVFQGEPNQSYKYMFFGGPNNTSSINTFNSASNQFLSPDNEWSLMPSLTTNNNGYSRVEGIFSVATNQNFCSAIDDYCYQLYVGIYNTATEQEDSHSVPQEFVVLPTNYFSFTPTPVPITSPSFSPTSRPSSITTTLSPTLAISSTNSSLLPTTSPSPTIDPTKFKTIASSSAGLHITPTLFDNYNDSDPNLNTIQTGSNPTKPSKFLTLSHASTTTNLKIKVIFIFLLSSISFTLYVLCFFGYSLDDVSPILDKVWDSSKSLLSRLFLTSKLSVQKTYKYLKIYLEPLLSNNKIPKLNKGILNIIFQKILMFLKICLKISQKIIKYFSYLLNQFFIFIKNHIHIKIPRKLKRYLYHKKNRSLSLFFLVFISLFFIKPISASIGPKINKSDIPTIENNFLTQDINLEPKQDFSWGVLSFNSNKSIYSLDETANLSMAVLDDKGAVVCDASLKLEIVLPDKTSVFFTTNDKQIKVNSQCFSQEVTSIPDYQSFFKLTQLGEYQVTLTAETNNGKYSIRDLFKVVQNSPFSVERISATRIYPLNSYPVTLKITANQDFEGNIVEKMPLSFTISQTDAKIETSQDNQLLKWDVNLKKDKTITLKYTYKAPEISPERYLLGPMELLSNSNNVFQEDRTWQIASDVPTHSDGILVFVSNGTIFNYKIWDGNEFGPTLSGPTLTGNGIVRHVASAVSDDGDYVGVVAEVYNAGLHSVYGTVWDVDANQWTNTSLLWSFTDTTVDNIHQRYFDITALGNDEFVVVGKEDPGTTLNNAGWLAGTGWTVETDLTTIGSVGKFVELIRRPGTTNLLLCTKDEALDTNCRYYKGATPYGTSANVNDDWTGNTEIMTTSDDGQNWDSHAFFDSTDNTRGAIIINPLSASGLTIRARRFTVTDSAITYGNTADSAALSDDYARSLLAPIPGRSEALVLGAGILEDLKAYRVGVTATTPNWTTILPNLEANGGIHKTTNDINFNWAMEFDGTRGIVAWAETGTANPVHFRRWTIDGDFEASEQQINGSPNNGYNRTMIARRDPIATDEILFIAVNDDVDISTAWWDGSANSFYTTGNKAWTEQASDLSAAIEDSFWSVEFQFFSPPGRPIHISPENSVTEEVTVNPTFTMVSTDADTDSIQYKIILGTDSAFIGTTQVFDQTISNVGWSGQNVGTSAYSSGTTASYIYQSTLDYSTVYFWKSQAIKSSESGTWSTSSDVYTFTTINDPDGVVEVFSNVGSTDWVAPDNVYSIKVQAWGGGGGGGDGISGFGGAGGGGGAYVSGTMAVVSGNTYPIIVGNGGAGGASSGDGSSGTDSIFNTNSFIAKGGTGGVGSSGMTAGSGGLAAESTGTIKYDGGTGGIGYNATSDAGGGGGGAGGPHGAGINGENANTIIGGHGGAGNNYYGGIGGIAANGSVGSTGASDPLGGGGGSGGDNGTAGGAGGSPGAGGGGGEANTAVTGKGSGGQVIIIYKIDTPSQDPPSTPTLISPSDSATSQSLTPTFQTVTTDDNGDHLQYELKICTDSGMTANCQTFDQTSGNVGWSGQDVGTSAYSSGTTATYILQVGNSLAENTTYYWKTRAKDYAGTDTWSSTQTTPYSFSTYSSQVSPNIPALVAPTNTATGQSLTPTFETVTTDNNNDNLQYELKICTDSGMTANCQTFDQTNSNIGWSGQDVGTSAYSSGTTATYILQIGNSLAENTTYYWKTRAKDYAGTDTWSSTQTTAYSFTTNSRPNTPTLVSPGNGTTAVSQTPELKTVTTDPNSDPLQYKIELCTNEAMSTGCNTYDLSSSITGWSGINVGTSAYSSGTTATYTVQVGSSLAASTTYYWRSYAKDPTGTTRWSTTQGTVYSFTTVTPVLVQATFRWSDDDASGESRSQGVGDTWYDSNYDYRAPITITNNVGTTLVDFQTRLTINTSTLISAGKMRSDCNDIRLTDNDKETSLSYYLESGCNTTNTVVWVKVPTLAASTTRDIYLYYGYSSATAASSGDNTFEIHDDFNGTSIDTNKWHDWNPQSWGTINVSGGTLAMTGGSTSGNEYARGLISNSPFPFSNHVIEMRSWWNTIGDINTNGYYQKTSSFRIGESYPSNNLADNNYTFIYIRYNGLFNIESHYYEFNKTISGAYSKVVESTINNDDPANFEITKYNYYTGPNQRAYRSTNEGSSFSALWSATNSNTLSNYYGPFIAARQSTDGSTTTLFDWFRIRKYTATEPTFSLGTETTEPPTAGSSGATWLAAENVGVTGVSPSENIRLRFSVANTGVVDSINLRLQVAPKGESTNCTDVASGNFADVTTTVGTNLAVMTTSPNFTNQEATTNQLTDSSSTFVAGKMVEYDSNQSDSITLNTNEFTEVEYNFQMTNNVGATTPYCFRVVDAGTTLSTYTNVAQLTTVYLENNVAPSAPYLPYVNNTTAQSGQQSPVYGLIDHTPSFSAIFDDPNPTDTAIYYQLQVGSDSDWASAEIWDSTKLSLGSTCNENSRCADIVYGGGTTLVDGSTYYWRIKFWDNSDVGSSWSDTLQFSMNNTPLVNNVIINGNNSINLSENSSIGISWMATVTDADGYTNLDTATGKLYRSGVGQSCSLDNNNCYQDTLCDFINCTGNTCDALCSADLYFFTEATDTGSTFVDQYYQAWVEANDNYTEIGSTLSSSTTVDVNTLSAFSIGQSLVYGEVFAGSDTGSSNTITTVTNTGNSLINLEITGDYMCTDYPSCGDQSIEPQYQQYNISTFTYGTGTTLSLSPRILNIGISKPTQSPSNSVKNLYWGIGIPGVKPPGNYQGSVTILVD